MHCTDNGAQLYSLLNCSCDTVDTIYSTSLQVIAAHIKTHKKTNPKRHSIGRQISRLQYSIELCTSAHDCGWCSVWINNIGTSSSRTTRHRRCSRGTSQSASSHSHTHFVFCPRNAYVSLCINAASITDVNAWQMGRQDDVAVYLTTNKWSFPLGVCQALSLCFNVARLGYLCASACATTHRKYIVYVVDVDAVAHSYSNHALNKHESRAFELLYPWTHARVRQ